MAGGGSGPSISEAYSQTSGNTRKRELTPIHNYPTKKKKKKITKRKAKFAKHVCDGDAGVVEVLKGCQGEVNYKNVRLQTVTLCVEMPRKVIQESEEKGRRNRKAQAPSGWDSSLYTLTPSNQAGNSKRL